MAEPPRRAEWRRSPDDPSTALGLLKRWPIEIYEAQGCYEWLYLSFGLSLMFSALSAIIGFPVLSASAVLLMYGWVLGLATLVGAIILEFGVARLWCAVETRLSPKRSPNTLSQLAILPPTETTYPVRVSVRYRGALTGTDVAIASFTEGWLTLEGSRMSCGLTARDGRGAWRKGQLWIDFPDGGSLALRRVVSSDFPMRSVKGPRHLWRDFEDDSKDWLSDGPPTEGVSVLPPLWTHWTMRKGWATLTLTGISLAILAIVLSKLVAAGGIAQALWLALAVMGGLTAMRGVFVRVHQDEADRHARRLQSSKPPRL